MNQIEKTAVSTRQKLAKELRSSASHTIPNDNHVDEVVNAPTAAEAQAAAKKGTRSRGRPKKKNNKMYHSD